MNVSCCDLCGDFLFDGKHRGQVEVWCRAIRDPVTRETVTAAASDETIIPMPADETITVSPTAETISVRRGRPRAGRASETITAAKPWAAAGLSRATWYRRMKA